jgi:L-ascorbate metabolism protein UlaG (beta-lactamase superfamily)
VTTLVDVVWLGHACFMLKGTVSNVMFDPFKGVGLREPRAKADIILCSHSHSDHNNVEAVRHEKSVVLEGFMGTKQVENVSIKGIATFHDDSHGSKRGRNSVYVVGLDQLLFCHLGDLGHTLSPSQIDDIGSIDVLFIPVGGFYTIDPVQARKVMESLKPRITVPMHYKLPGMSATFNALSTVGEFIHTDDNLKRLDTSRFTISNSDLPERPVIMVPKLS